MHTFHVGNLRIVGQEFKLVLGEFLQPMEHFDELRISA
jgi:hypothetical protein